MQSGLCAVVCSWSLAGFGKSLDTQGPWTQVHDQEVTHGVQLRPVHVPLTGSVEAPLVTVKPHISNTQALLKSTYKLTWILFWLVSFFFFCFFSCLFFFFFFLNNLFLSFYNSKGHFQNQTSLLSRVRPSQQAGVRDGQGPQSQAPREESRLQCWPEAKLSTKMHNPTPSAALWSRRLLYFYMATTHVIKCIQTFA